MIVDLQKKPVNFQDIAQGEPFTWGDEVYIKIRPIITHEKLINKDLTYNALHIETGEATWIDDETKVTPINAKVVIRG